MIRGTARLRSPISFVLEVMSAAPAGSSKSESQVPVDFPHGPVDMPRSLVGAHNVRMWTPAELISHSLSSSLPALQHVVADFPTVLRPLLGMWHQCVLKNYERHTVELLLQPDG